MVEGQTRTIRGQGALSELLRARQDAILAAWTAQVRPLIPAHELSTPALIDHVPLLLTRIVHALEAGDHDDASGHASSPQDHAANRLALGFDLEHVVIEYALLRRTILDTWHQEHQAAIDAADLAVLDRTLDDAIVQASQAFAAVRERMLEALDRISDHALGDTELQPVLAQLVRACVDALEAADMVAILIRDRDLLQVRASIGLPDELVHVSDGFVGRVVAEARPLSVSPSGSSDIAELGTGLRALYGVPLTHRGEVIGVALVGSRSAFQLSEESKQLFRTLASRATLVIRHVSLVMRDRASSAAARAFATATTFDTAFELLLSELASTLQWDVGCLWRVDPTNAKLVAKTVWKRAGIEVPEFEHVTVRTAFARGEGLPGLVWERGAMVHVLDFNRDPRIPRRAIADSEGLRTGIGFPLALGDQVLGVIELFSTAARASTEETVYLATLVTEQLRQFTGRVGMQEELQRRSAQHAATIEAALDCVISMDAHGQVVGWNAAAERTFGYARAEALGRPLAELIIPPPLRAAHYAGLNRYLTTGQHVYINRRLETTAIRHDGSEFPIELTITQLPGEAAPIFIGFVRDLTDAKRAEQERDRSLRELEEERERLRAMLEQLPAGVLIAEAPSGRMVWRNRKVDEIWRRDTPAGDSATESDQWVAFDATGRQVQAHEFGMARALSRGEIVLDEELEIVRGDGTRGVIKTNAAPITDAAGRVVGAIAVFYDVTKQAELERERARLLLDIRDAERTHRFLSDASKQLAESMDYEETLAKIAQLAVPTVADWCAVDLVDAGATHRVSIAHSDPAKRDLVEAVVRAHPTPPDSPHGVPFVLRTGQTEWAADISDSLLEDFARSPEHLELLRSLGLRSYIVAPMIARGRVLGALSLVAAERGRRYTEDDVAVAEELARRAAVALDNVRLHREIQEGVRLRENVLAVVSHDLRNPLGAIALSAELLATSKRVASNPAAFQKQLDIIQRSATRMERLIGDLLDMANIQAGQLSIELAHIDLRDVLLEATDASEPQARAEGISLRRDLPSSPVFVHCDRHRIVQAISNILGNAVKYTSSGDAITVRATVTDREVTVALADTGPGISPDHLPRIFDPYWTVQRKGKSGTGLGLYITKGIIEAHGGRIWAESTLGEGTTFHFTLPLADVAR